MRTALFFDENELIHLLQVKYPRLVSVSSLPSDRTPFKLIGMSEQDGSQFVNDYGNSNPNVFYEDNQVFCSQLALGACVAERFGYTNANNNYYVFYSDDAGGFFFLSRKTEGE